MPLTLATPPPTALAAVTGALDRLQARATYDVSGGGPSAVPRALSRVGRNRMTASVPHPLYQLTLQQLVAGAGLAEARLTGWRYLLEDGGERVLGFAETTAPADQAAAVTMRALNTGPFAQATRDAIEDAERRDFASGGQREVRVLRVPGLSVTALWLAETDAGHAAAEDTLIVLSPAPTELTPNVPMPGANILALLRPLAEARLSFLE